MKKTKETYLEFMYPGVITAEYSQKKVEGREPKKLEWPDGAYAAQYFDIYTIEDEGHVYKTRRENLSPLYYKPDAKVMTVEDVEREMPNEKILISNMKCNKWDKVVFSRFGDRYSWPQVFSKDCVILTNF